jgi:hypothetical protein
MSKIGELFAESDKGEKAQQIFRLLEESSEVMITFAKEIVDLLDDFIDKVQKVLNVGSVQNADRLRLELRIESKDISDQLQRIIGDMTDLVVIFADITDFRGH